VQAGARGKKTGDALAALEIVASFCPELLQNGEPQQIR
jgi:hypothetical protein